MDASQLLIRIVHVDGVVELVADGLLDATTAPLLREELQTLFDAGFRQVVIDLGKLVFLDSAGLGVLVGSLKRYRCDSGSVDIRNPQRQVRRVLDITGVAEVFGLDNGTRKRGALKR